MNRFTKAVLVPILFLIEYVFKFLAGVGAAIVLAADGSLWAKLGTGYASVIPAIRQLTNFPEQWAYLSTVIEDYNTLTAAAFNQRYGGQAINALLVQLNEGVSYLQAIYQNIISSPISTILATLIIFLSLYLIGRISRFVRQKGQGSILDRAERKLGDQVFKNRHNSNH